MIIMMMMMIIMIIMIPPAMVLEAEKRIYFNKVSSRS
jgi:hypothetical protein